MPATTPTRSSAKRRPRASHGKPVPAHLHGTTHAYNNFLCRCAECRAANTRYHRIFKARGLTASKRYTAAQRRLRKAAEAEQARVRADAVEAQRVESLTALLDRV